MITPVEEETIRTIVREKKVMLLFLRTVRQQFQEPTYRVFNVGDTGTLEDIVHKRWLIATVLGGEGVGDYGDPTWIPGGRANLTDKDGLLGYFQLSCGLDYKQNVVLSADEAQKMGEAWRKGFELELVRQRSLRGVFGLPKLTGSPARSSGLAAAGIIASTARPPALTPTDQALERKHTGSPDHAYLRERFNNDNTNLWLLTEEAGEIVRACGKLGRWGLYHKHQITGEDSMELLQGEAGDFLAIVEIMIARGHFTREAVHAAVHAKLERLEDWYDEAAVPVKSPGWLLSAALGRAFADKTISSDEKPKQCVWRLDGTRAQGWLCDAPALCGKHRLVLDSDQLVWVERRKRGLQDVHLEHVSVLWGNAPEELFETTPPVGTQDIQQQCWAQATEWAKEDAAVEAANFLKVVDQCVPLSEIAHAVEIGLPPGEFVGMKASDSGHVLVYIKANGVVSAWGWDKDKGWQVQESPAPKKRGMGHTEFCAVMHGRTCDCAGGDYTRSGRGPRQLGSYDG